MKLQQLSTGDEAYAQAMAIAGLHVDFDGPRFAAFTDDQRLVGYIGYDLFGEHVLLRSVLIFDDARDQGFGQKMVRLIEEKLTAMGIAHLHLLTLDAAKFFQHCGFLEAPRSDAPSVIKQCGAYQNLCPASAHYLFKDLTAQVA